VIEAETVTAAERNRGPPPETEAEKAKLEQRLSAMAPGEAQRKRREHNETRTELFFRRALSSRHVYVLSRLHARYDASSLPRDFEIGPAEHPVQGGVQVPVGPAAVLPMDTRSASQSRLQMRFVATRPWSGPVACLDPVHWRWGKRWKSLGHVWRAVAIAQDLPRCGRDLEALTEVLETPLPAFGLMGAPPVAQAPEPRRVPPRPAEGGCSMSARPAPSRFPIRWLGLLGLAPFFLCRPWAGRSRPS
jgi:hypothetical protein